MFCCLHLFYIFLSSMFYSGCWRNLLYFTHIRVNVNECRQGIYILGVNGHWVMTVLQSNCQCAYLDNGHPFSMTSTRIFDVFAYAWVSKSEEEMESLPFFINTKIDTLLAFKMLAETVPPLPASICLQRSCCVWGFTVNVSTCINDVV